ncbi:hypothetical protein [Desulfurococcus mucosus]|uniref:Uncharacterized protein n=1 Tax=Desulfurococcus mucosus (strain ATCC 35584 / DSM 2162 / JCM 9187 / O7/1) TaxID=765177 RepID=E8R7V2_DESM0|nr:hypothetical protein [Desulfurococcus mucosus]ADV64578.1 hypothetical protein Desmu_0259 [Desulfurococcus mucosus DSM 2162]
MSGGDGFVYQLIDFLESKGFTSGEVSVIPVSTHPWNTATVVNRLSEELGIRDFIVLTRRELVDDVYQSLSQEPGAARGINVYVDHAVARSILRDSVFENSIVLEHLVKSISGMVKKIYVDLSLTTGPFAITLQGTLSKMGPSSITYTYVDAIPLPGLPQYPGSPRWIHRVYVYEDGGVAEPGEGGAGRGVREQGLLEKKIAWRGTKGVFEDVSQVFNRLADVRIAERLTSEARRDVSEDSPVLTVNALNPVNGERKRLVSLKPVEGPDEDSVNMMMGNWRVLADIVCGSHPDADRSSIERILMQIQRYTGAVDLIAREIEGHGSRDYEGWKLHSLLLDMHRRLGKPVALLPDTNMFYQGLHMTLLKASIRNGRPWSPVEGIRVYIPVCAEAEINGKVAGVSSETTGISRYSYVMALLANRAVDEIKQYYRGIHLPAVSQPCEASIAVVEQSLSEDRVVLVTADKKAYNAWITLNVCKERATCIYIGHRNRPLNADGLYSKLYASIVLANQVYTAGSILPLELSTGDRRARVTLETLQGADAPVLNIVEEPGSA